MQRLLFGNPPYNSEVWQKDVTVLQARPRVYPQTVPIIPAFSFRAAEAGPVLPTTEGWMTATNINFQLQPLIPLTQRDVVSLRGGSVVVRVSDLGSKDPGFDPRAMPKSECMLVNIYHYQVVSYVILCV